MPLTKTLTVYDINTGTGIDLTPNIAKQSPVLLKPNIVDEISSTQNISQAIYPQRLLKKIRRDQATIEDKDFILKSTQFKGASTIGIAQKTTQVIGRDDNIIISFRDMLVTDETVATMAAETASFLGYAMRKDLTLLLSLAISEATTAKLFSTVDANGGATGTQPTQTDNKFASALAALQTGARQVTIDKTEIDAANTTNRMDIIRAAFNYLYNIGTENSVEALYPYVISGADLKDLVLVTTYDGAVKIKDSFTSGYFPVGPQNKKVFNGLVAMIDTVPVFVSSLLPQGVEYMVMTRRVLVRYVAKTLQDGGNYIANLGPQGVGAVVDETGKAVNLKASERNLQFESYRQLGVYYEHELFIIKTA